MHVCDWIAMVGIPVAVASLVFAYWQWHDAKEQAIDFDKKRSTFVGYPHGRKSHRLQQEERDQVDDMLERFDRPRRRWFRQRSRFSPST